MYDNQGPVPSIDRWLYRTDDSQSSLQCTNLSSEDSIRCLNDGLKNGDVDSQGNMDASSYVMNTGGPCIRRGNDGKMEYGLYIDDSVCVSFDSLRTSPTEDVTTTEGKKDEDVVVPLRTPQYTDCMPPTADFNTICQKYDPTFYPLLVENCDMNSNRRALCGLNTSCLIKNTNFEKVCKEKYDDTYGVYQIEPCEEKELYRATCSKNYLNGRLIDSEKTTPCIDKSLDFDAMCKYYVSHDAVDTAHWGAQSILNGRDGGCYKKDSNGQDVPDDSKSIAVCSSQYENTLPNVSSYFKDQNYNVYTSCLPMDSNFRKECADKLNSTVPNAYALDIMGYDCNPQYARAKCIDLTRIPKLDPSISELMNQIQTNSVPNPSK
jgi:hypothetical protein